MSALRVVLWVVVGMGVVGTLLSFVLTDNPTAAGRMSSTVVLGAIAALIVVLLMPRRSRGVRIGINIVAAVMVLLSLGTLGQGNPFGLVSLGLHVAILVLVNLQPTRTYLSSPSS